MLKSFRYLLQYAWVHLGTLLAFAAIVVAGSYLTGVPEGADNLFTNYMTSFPVMIVFILFMYGFGLCTSYMNLALAMGARRRDYFWGLQLTAMFYAAVAVALQALLSVLPTLGGWTQLPRWNAALTLGGANTWAFALVFFLAMLLGCLAGLVMYKSKVWGIVIICAAMVALLFGTIAVKFMSALDLWTFLMDSAWSGLWGMLPGVLVCAAAAVLAGSEYFIWRTIKRSVVR